MSLRPLPSIAEIEPKIVVPLLTVGTEILRYGLILIYLWFGAAKLYAPGDGLELVSGLISMMMLPMFFGQLLALWEIAIAIMFMRTEWVRYAAINTIVHLLGTFLPMAFLPWLTINDWPWLTLHGQFVIKNVALVGAAMVVWAATIRRQQMGR